MIDENININNTNGDMTDNISDKPETQAPVSDNAPAVEPCEPVSSPETVTEQPTEISPVPQEPVFVSEVNENQPKYVYHWELQAENAPTKEKKAKKRNSGTVTFFAVMAAALTVAILLLAAVIYFTPDNSGGAAMGSLSELYDACCPYTVAIETNAGSIGSGFFVTENGYVVTNHHVISGATSVLVYTNDSQKYSADIVGSDPELDLAVLKVNGKNGQTFPAARIANSDDVKTGDSIIVIGTPERLDLAWSLTTGYVSYAKRESNMSGTMQTYIQISAGVNPGNSGGPLINAKGEVIGIIQARVKDKVEVYDSDGNIIGYTMPGADGLGLAIPINKVISTFNKLIDENMEEPILGITCVTVIEGNEYFMTDGSAYAVMVNDSSEKYYVAYDSFTQEQTTVIITDEVLKNGTLFIAEKTGIWIEEVSNASGAKGILKKGDIITKFGDVTLSDKAGSNTNLVSVIKDELANYKAGDNVDVTYIRDGKVNTVSIKLTAKQ